MDRIRPASHAAMLVAAGLLFGRADFLPDWAYARAIELSAADKPFDLVFTSEKALLLPVLLLCTWNLHGLRWGLESPLRVLRLTAVATLLGVACLVGPALAIRYVALEPKLPSVILAWAAHNLLFVSLIEELVFRGYVFEGLARLWSTRNRGALLAAVASSLLFGAMHFRGGASFVFLASIAGLIYAFAYRRAGLLAATFSHFGVNLLHFLLFSYPALKPGH